MSPLSLRSLAASLFLFQSVYATAIPQAAKAPALVKPGPGFPSLESLGLTQKDLFDPEFLTKRNITLPERPEILPGSRTVAAAQYNPTCNFNTGTEGTRANAIACRNYLTQLGSAFCDVPSGASSSTLCTAGDTSITGWNYYSLTGDTISDCSDVAIGAGWIIDNCSSGTFDTSLVEGTQSTPANDYYVVYIGLDGALTKLRNAKHTKK